MAALKLVIVENEFLALIPSGKASKAVPMARLRDIPAFLSRCSSPFSLSNIMNQVDVNQNDIKSSIEMEGKSLHDLSGCQKPRTERGAFCIPSGDAVQIYATGRDKTYVMIREGLRLHVSNTSGYWIADFCGVGGFQQVLWLPPISVEMTDWRLDDAKRILTQILHQSVLTDGSHVNISMGTNVEQMNTPTGASHPNIVLSQVAQIPNGVEPMELSSPEDERKEKPDSRDNGEQSAWRTTINKALESRLRKERTNHQKRVETQQMKQLLLRKNQEALRTLVNPEGTSIEAARIRYRTLPSGTGSATVYMEVDVVIKASSTLFGLHLSCTPRSTSGVCIRTHSGIVPELQNGACVTIIAIAEVNGVVFSDQAGECAIRINVEASWTTAKGNDREKAKRRRASQVSLIELPLESLLLIQHDMKHIHYPATLDRTEPMPTAVYECRNHSTLQIDISSCPPCEWKAFAKTIETIFQGSGHRIDVKCPEEGHADTVSITIFSFPEEDLLGMLLPSLDQMYGRTRTVSHIFSSCTYRSSRSCEEASA